MSKGIKVDLGCGPSPRQGYKGLDISDFGQDWKFDLEHKDIRELFKPDSVEAVYASHFFEHLSGLRVVKLVNEELPEVMMDGAELWIIVPHKDSPKAHSLWHQTFWTEFTFRNLLEEVTYHNNTVVKKKPWKITELVTNARPDIHCKATLNKKDIVKMDKKKWSIYTA